MRSERLFRILGLVDSDLVEEAMSAAPSAAPRRRSASWRTLGLAACLVLVCGLGLLWARSSGGAMNGALSGGADGSAPGASAGSGGSGHSEGTVFMSYAGPVFPLTAREEDTGLTADRALAWDFAPGAYPDGEPRQWGAEVTDRYILTNLGAEDVAITAHGVRGRRSGADRPACRALRRGLFQRLRFGGPGPRHAESGGSEQLGGVPGPAGGRVVSEAGSGGVPGAGYSGGGLLLLGF